MKKHELYDKYITDTLSDEEEKELLERLEDEETADQFAEYIIETNMILSAAEDVQFVVPKKKAPIKWILLAAAACLVFGIVLFQNQRVTFEVIASTSKEFSKGAIIQSKDVKLIEGLVELKMNSGDYLEIKGPIEFSVKKMNSINLKRGKINVRLADHTDSFTVHTPHGSVKDLGTAFGLKVIEEGTELHVYEGKVELKAGSFIEKLVAGESKKVNQQGEVLSIEFQQNIMNEPELIYLGQRTLLPGEEKELFLDSYGKEITADVDLSFEDNKNFKYKLQAFSSGKLIYETDEHNAEDKYKITIPAKASKNLVLKMKVTKGSVRKGILKLKNLSLQTKGLRPYEGDLLIPAGADWYYHFESEAPLNWMTNDFDHTQWKKAPASLGYGDKDLITQIGPGSLRKTISCIYLKSDFIVQDLEISDLQKIKVNLLADDGAAVYINGVEAIRHNIEEGPVTSKTRALKRAVTTSGEMIYRNFSVPANVLKQGKNIITVMLFQIGSKSSDMRFDLQMSVY